MKNYFRAVAAVLLCVLLIGFTAWRQERLPDLSVITAAVQQAAGEMDALKAQLHVSLKPILPVAPPSSGDEGNGGYFPDFNVSEGIDATLEATICQGLDECQPAIDIAAYGITTANIAAVIAEITLSHPEYFYVSDRFTYAHAGDHVTQLKPAYLYGQAEIQAKKEAYQAYVDGIVALVPGDATDFDKLLFLHDYFVMNYSYDYSYTVRDAYTFFEKKTGVCQAYMLALIATAEAVGIESIPVTSSAMRHAWNLVLLDGEWYHVDVTWDDSLSVPSMTSYTYFLRSDAGMGLADQDKAEPHRDWQSTEQADDTRYDTAAWHQAITPILKTGGRYYCTLSEDGNVEKNVYGAIWGGEDVTAMTRLQSIHAVWRVSGSSRHVNCFTTLLAYNGGILYNTNSSLRFYDPASGRDTLVALLSLGQNQSVYGMLSLSSDKKAACVLGPYDLSATQTMYVDIAS